MWRLWRTRTTIKWRVICVCRLNGKTKISLWSASDASLPVTKSACWKTLKTSYLRVNGFARGVRSQRKTHRWIWTAPSVESVRKIRECSQEWRRRSVSRKAWTGCTPSASSGLPILNSRTSRPRRHLWWPARSTRKSSEPVTTAKVASAILCPATLSSVTRCTIQSAPEMCRWSRASRRCSPRSLAVWPKSTLAVKLPSMKTTCVCCVLSTRLPGPRNSLRMPSWWSQCSRNGQLRTHLHFFQSVKSPRQTWRRWQTRSF